MTMAMKAEVIGKAPRDTFYDGLNQRKPMLRRLEERSRIFRSAVVLFEGLMGMHRDKGDRALREVHIPREVVFDHMQRNGKVLLMGEKI